MSPTTAHPALVHLREAACSLLVDCRAPGLPRVLHWGRDLGDLDQTALEEVAHALHAQQVSNTMDETVPLGLLPEASRGWAGTPGLQLHRDGSAFSTLLVVDDIHHATDDDGTSRLVVSAQDPDEHVAVVLELQMSPSGLIRQRAQVVNTGDGTVQLDGVLLTLPVPADAREVLDLTGRHLRERSPQRHAFTLGTHLREGRRGRTGTDASLVMAAGEPGFGFRSGQVWAMHIGWSGNHRALAEALPDGRRLLAGGELLLPGEVRLHAGQSYDSPWIYAAHGDGLDQVSARFHGFLRSRPEHPRSPRPITVNTWEAVYFDHDIGRLRDLADRAAGVGAERFVLDDGWFRGRRDDRAGLGDWYVDEQIWPDGLTPLVDHVHALGMQFGLWVEPEMINEDSDLAREHPDWILQVPTRMPPRSRHQQVLDLSCPEAFDHILQRLDTLVAQNHVDYLKWDHNRDLVDAGSVHSGTARVHEQTLAFYALVDELRSRHHDLEIESCSSGGGRVDLGALARTDRVWASDCIDPLERQQIQRWTSLLLPLEMIGSHIGAPTSHTTGRTHALDFRAGTALLCHLGIEWDLGDATANDLALLREWLTAHRDIRDLAHSGTLVRADHPDPALEITGVVATDRSRAIYSLAQVATSVQSPAGLVRLPGLDPDAAYRIEPFGPGATIAGPAQSSLPWWATGVTMSGRVLAELGLQAPTQYPERVVLVQASRLRTAISSQSSELDHHP